MFGILSIVFGIFFLVFGLGLAIWTHTLGNTLVTLSIVFGIFLASGLGLAILATNLDFGGFVLVYIGLGLLMSAALTGLIIIGALVYCKLGKREGLVES